MAFKLSATTLVGAVIVYHPDGVRSLLPGALAPIFTPIQSVSNMAS